LTLHQNDAILTPSDETATVTTMNFLTFEDNYLAGQSPERKIIMTNKEKALALIGTFVSGDTAKAKELLAPGYIQHNLAFGTGADAFVAAVEGLAQAPVKTTVNNIRAFEDGDKVFLQTVYNFAGAGEQVGFDVFRFDEDGKIAEHWDDSEYRREEEEERQIKNRRHFKCLLPGYFTYSAMARLTNSAVPFPPALSMFVLNSPSAAYILPRPARISLVHS
jgi:predicted SnoaL-like aldol condensation-catalyzing enzyme